MDLPSIFRGGRRRLLLGLALFGLAAVVTVGIIAGGSRSGSPSGRTGGTGPTGATESHHEGHSGRGHTASRKPKKVAVPNVVGEQRDAALAELVAHSLRGRFVSHQVALICADAAPTARVVGQFPKPGDHVRPGAHIGLSASAYAQTGCGPAKASRVCDPSELSLRITQGMPEYTGGSEDALVTVYVKHTRGGSPCAVDSTIDLAIEQPQGQLADRLHGNPAMLELHAALDLGEEMVAGWILGSWCGSRHNVAAVARMQGLSASESLTQLPYGAGPCPTLGMFELARK
jgi:hypothetical protein